MRSFAKRWLNWLAVRSAPFRGLKRWLVATQGRLEAARVRLPADVDRAALMPDFLCIGAQKAATTWLHDALSRHPDVYMPTRRKEIGFFGWQEHLGLDWYLAHFVDGLGKVKGEAFPGYGPMAPVHIAALRQRLPALKVILMLRDPIDRAWSHARMGLIRDGGFRFDQLSLAQWQARLSSDSCLAHGRYARILSNWRAEFPAEQIKVGYFETVARAPDVQLGEILDFLGVAPGDYPDAESLREPSNATESHPIPPALERFVAATVVDDLRALQALLPGPQVEAWLRRAEAALAEPR